MKNVADLTLASAILQYWNEIISGGVAVGKWIKLLYDVILQGLTERLGDLLRKLGQLVEEKHAVMRQGYFAGSGIGASADESGHRYGVVG